MTRSTLLLTTALGLAMVLGASADAKNAPGFMARGDYNAKGLAGHLLPPGSLKRSNASLIERYERGFSTYSYSKGVTSISNPSTGNYCIVPSKPVKATSSAQVTLEWDFSSGFSFVDFWVIQAGDCAAGDVEVKTYDASGNLTDLSAFTLIIDN